jgi:hypothetical protein
MYSTFASLKMIVAAVELLPDGRRPIPSKLKLAAPVSVKDVVRLAPFPLFNQEMVTARELVSVRCRVICRT